LQQPCHFHYPIKLNFGVGVEAHLTMYRHSLALRWTALGSMALVASLLFPGQAAAEPSVPPSSVLQTGRAVVTRQAVTLKAPQAPKASASAATQSNLESKSFFKTKAGAATLILFGAGVGFAVYSSSNDRVRGANR